MKSQGNMWLKHCSILKISIRQAMMAYTFTLSAQEVETGTTKK